MRIVGIPITATYSKNPSTHKSVYQGIDVMMSTFKFVSIEHPLRFYGIRGAVCLTVATYFRLGQSRMFYDVLLLVPASIVISNIAAGVELCSLDKKARWILVCLIVIHLVNYSLRSLANMILPQ